MRLFLFAFILSQCLLTYAQDFIIVDKIELKGNKRTKNDILLREFTFSTGDTIERNEFRKKIQRTRENIYNLHLFNFVEADTAIDENNKAEVVITVLERWYIWPVPILEHAGRNFGAWLYEKEYERINYGLFLVMANVRGRNETFMMKIRPGWREQYGFLYSIPALNRKKTLGLELTYSFFRQKIFLLDHEGNKPFYFVADEYCYKQNRARTTFSYRPSLYFLHNFSVIYNDFIISDSALAVNPAYIGMNQKNTGFYTLAYEPEIEKRNIVAFPTKGYYAGLRIQYSGFSSAKPINAWNLGITVSAYQPAGERFFFATGLDAGFHTLNYESFIFDQAIGYGNYIRGFELYTINGNTYWMQKSSVNYNLVKTRTKTFGKKEKYHKFLKLHYAMYLSAFLDMGYVHSDYHRQSYQNTLLTGYGLGLNLVTYYDWVVRIEYSVSRYGENRVYLHSHVAF